MESIWSIKTSENRPIAVARSSNRAKRIFETIESSQTEPRESNPRKRGSENLDSPIQRKRLGLKGLQIGRETSFLAKKENSLKAIQIADIQSAIKEAIKPLMQKTIELKKEIQDISIELQKWKNQAQKPVSKPTVALPAVLVPTTPEKRTNKTIIGKTPKIVQLAKKLDNSKPSQARVEISEPRKTFAEIARLNSLEKDSQLVQATQAWTTVVRKQKNLPQELAPKRGLDPVNKRILFTRLETGKKSVVLHDLLLAINLASKKIGFPKYIRLIKL